MPRITFVLPDGSEASIDHAGGVLSLMELARQHGVAGIRGDCGGMMACATCHVHVDPGWIAAVGDASPDERDLVELTADPRAISRLACQIWIRDALDGLRVQVAPC